VGKGDERGTKRGDLPNDVERPERTIRPVRLRHPMAHFGVRRAKDGGDSIDVHWHRDPGCAGGSDGCPFFAKKAG
jgi:hypothetical protein